MTRRALMCVVLPAVFAASSGLAQEAADQTKQLENEKLRLEREVRGPLYGKLREIRSKLVQEADMGDLRAAAAAAQKALEQKTKSDPAVLEAEAGKNAASKALDQAVAGAAAADPDVVGLKKDLDAAYGKRDEAGFEQRLAAFMLGEVRRRLSRSPQLREAADNATKADRALTNLPQTHPQVAAARKALDDARKAYDAKTKSLPEYARMVQAQKACDELMKTDPAAQAAAAERSRARKAYEERLVALVAADPDAKAQTEKMRKAEQDMKDARAATREIENKIRAATRAIATKHPKVAEARKGLNDAHNALRKVVAQLTVDEKKAFDAANKALNQKVEEKVKSDVEGAAVLAELKSVNEKIRDLQNQIRKVKSQKRS